VTIIARRHVREYGGDPWSTPRMFTSIMRFHSSILSSASGGKRHDTGVIDDHVDLAEPLQRKFGEGLHVGEIRDIERAILCRTAGRANFSGQFFKTVGAARAEHERGAFGREMAGGGFAYSLLAPVMRMTLFSMFVFMLFVRCC
jgi:hypothetical protein